MLRTVIIDDELNNRQMISDLLDNWCPKVQKVGEAEGVESGVKAIHQLHPDLVLLDIKMDDGDGFDLLERVGSIDFKVIFITAYEEYAIKAFKFSAIDYLLKPVDPDDLVEAIDKAETQILKDLKYQLSTLTENLHPEKRKTLVLRTSDKIHYLDTRNIIRCESDRNYTLFHLNNSQRIIVSNPVKDYEELLDDYGFFRIHKSHLVNLSFVESYIKGDGGYLLLKNKTKLPVSMRKKEMLLERLSSL
jgi:two-component system LytT family response regulator